MLKLKHLITLLCLTIVTSPTLLAKAKQDGSHIQKGNYYPQVKIITSMGDIIIELDRSRAPITVNNFLLYVQKRSYENTLFHRVEPDFVIQGGGYDLDFNEKSTFAPIFNESGNGLKNKMYNIAMARKSDPHTATRQFFFNMSNNTSLDPGRNWGYTVFGAVQEGYEVLDKMMEVKTDIDPKWGWPNVPVEKIIIKRMVILPAS